jgi:hypothetical protein
LLGTGCRYALAGNLNIYSNLGHYYIKFHCST